MPVTASGNTDIGSSRSSNEDSFGISDDLKVYVVADGMGGHAAGEVASRMAVDTMLDYMLSTQNQSDPSFSSEVAARDLPLPAKRLLMSGKTANGKIYEKSRSDTKLSGMGTTVVGMTVDGNTAFIAHAGDSRAYLIRSDSIEQITSDHSLVKDYVSQGILREEDTGNHPLKHVITRALGTSAKIELDVNTIHLNNGDIVLLCSDGLSNPLSDQEFLASLKETRNDLKEACERLIKLALQKGADDNLTLVLVAYTQ